MIKKSFLLSKICFVVLCLMFCSFIVYAAEDSFNKTINVQGKLTTDSGQPITGTTNVTLYIYSDSSGSGGNSWSKDVTADSDGIYSADIEIGDVSFKEQKYFKVKAGNVESAITPFAASPNAFYASTATYALSLDPNGDKLVSANFSPTEPYNINVSTASYAVTASSISKTGTSDGLVWATIKDGNKFKQGWLSPGSIQIGKASTSNIGGIKLAENTGLSKDIESDGILRLLVPTASSLGGVKIGTNIDMADDGTISVATGGTETLGVVNVSGSNGLSINEGTISVSVATAGDNTTSAKYGTVKLYTSTTSVTEAEDGTYTAKVIHAALDEKTDTKNTAGASATTNKIFLIGATSQEDNLQTYSQANVYADANGRLNSAAPANDANDTTVATTGWVVGKNYLTSHQTIKQDGITGATINRYASSTTGKDTRIKLASITSGTFALETGTRVSVKFSATNEANNPQLKIGNTDAKDIYHRGSKIGTGTNKSLLSGVCDFVYDGSRWNLIGNYLDPSSTASKLGDSESGFTPENVITVWAKDSSGKQGWVSLDDNAGNNGQVINGADLAEIYQSTEKLVPGDVVSIDTTKDNAIVKTKVAEDTLVAGVISTEPGVLMNQKEKGYKLALVGKVPTKVCNEGGAIKRGDLLVSASIPGYAKKAGDNPKVGTVIGKSLENLDSQKGTILVLVNLQ